MATPNDVLIEAPLLHPSSLSPVCWIDCSLTCCQRLIPPLLCLSCCGLFFLSFFVPFLYHSMLPLNSTPWAFVAPALRLPLGLGRFARAPLIVHRIKYKYNNKHWTTTNIQNFNETGRWWKWFDYTSRNSPSGKLEVIDWLILDWVHSWQSCRMMPGHTCSLHCIPICT